MFKGEKGVKKGLNVTDFTMGKTNKSQWGKGTRNAPEQWNENTLLVRRGRSQKLKKKTCS